LASKSNYQNILDGTTVPGVVYPSSLSTNLTSKRTSHKIAEQGRRNRINTALQEMQDLLPPSHITPDAKSPETVAQSNNSKAAKVESAIDYIKLLKKQCSDKDKMLSEKDVEMEALRKQLAELRRGSSVSSPSASETAPQPKCEPATTTTASDET
jgi:vacuolar-type H+-ATPase subunit I/STV1